MSALRATGLQQWVDSGPSVAATADVGAHIEANKRRDDKRPVSAIADIDASIVNDSVQSRPGIRT
jgi:hypothetical protein